MRVQKIKQLFSRRKEIIGFLIPVLFSLFFSFNQLGTLRPNVSLDELRYASFAASLEGAPYVSYYAKSDGYVDNHPTFFLYQMLWAFDIFGVSPFSMRLVSVIYGVLAVGVFYLFLRRLFTLPQAVFGGIVLAVSYKFVALTRWTNEVGVYFFFLALCLLFLIIYYQKLRQKERGLKYLFLLGLSLGMLQHTYGSARVYLLAFQVVLLLFWVVNRVNKRVLLRGALIFVIGLLIPLYTLFVTYKNLPAGSLDSRNSDLMVTRSDVSLKDKAWALRRTTTNTVGMFNIKGSDESCYSYYGSKFLDPLSGWLFLVGLVVSFFVFRGVLAAGFLFLFASALLPSLFSVVGATPHEVRASAAIIFTSIYVTVGAWFLADLTKRPRVRGFFLFSVGLFIIAFNFNSFFVRQMSFTQNCYVHSSSELEKTVETYRRSETKPFIIYNPFF